MPAVDRTGRPVALNDAGQIKAVRFLYGTAFGRVLTGILVRPWLSRVAGAFLDTGLSRRLIPGFIQKNTIDMSVYEKADYASFNAFFCRRIRKAARPVDPDENAFVSPADSKLTVLPVTPDARFSIKNIGYTFAELVRDGALAEKYAGGTLLIFRLTVGDYHRYGWPVSGTAHGKRKLAGVYHTVHPLAAEKRPLYAENTRELCLVDSGRFGTVLMMEVGALLVGRIVNGTPEGPAVRGEEKGHFEYGGSTVICCLEKGRLTVDPDLAENSRRGLETAVKYGERIGIASEE